MSIRIAGVDVAIGPVISPGDPKGGPYDPFNPSKTIFSKGHRRNERKAPFKVDTIFEKDIVLPMRDGIRLYADVFRPVIEEKVPAIVIWSPYGKTGNGPHGLDMVPGRFGVAEDATSGYEKFEGIDPAEWTARGYAVVNCDLRGSWDSEGIVPWLGEQDGRDGHDAVEHLAGLPWCSGKVGLAGNSWLAMSQWFIAAERPPHLAAFAPWEGASDFYRDTLCRGGIPYPYNAMWTLLETTMVGRNGTEAINEMIKKDPLYNDYFEDKRAKLDRIVAPAYVLASYSTSLHTSGSIRGYNQIASTDKWLRIHARQEWSDLYAPESTDDLQKFFDFYLKSVSNDWKMTNPVRVSLLGFNQPSIVNVPFKTYPVSESKDTTLYLNPYGDLSNQPFGEANTASYDASLVPKQLDSDGEELVFSYKFSKPTWLLGYSKLVVYVSSDTDDVDVFVQLRKLDSSGKQLQHMNVPPEKLHPPVKSQDEVPNSCFLKYFGPTGALRASHTVGKIDKDYKDPENWPQYSHRVREPVKPGTIVRLEIPIWPGGIVFSPGESLAVKISGHYMSMMEFEFLNGSHQNEGRTTVHFGGKYDSHLVVPLMDPVQ